jgi:ATP-dependent exoDNAse (exonuclease V) alpha subunit
MVAGWDASRQQHLQNAQVVLAFRREDVLALNTLACSNRLTAVVGLGQTHDVQTSRGCRPMAQGDRMTFPRNDRKLSVQNGTLGTVGRIDAG